MVASNANWSFYQDSMLYVYVLDLEEMQVHSLLLKPRSCKEQESFIAFCFSHFLSFPCSEL